MSWIRGQVPRRRQTRRSLACAALCGRLAPCLILAAGLATGCDRNAPGSKPKAGDASPAPIGGAGLNVLLVSVDTTRADCLGCYGHPVVKTPHIDRLAAEGARFSRCIASAPLTLVSHATMLTGSYPFVHGARDNGSYQLGPQNVTLAEQFKAAGYDTHAEVAAAVMNRLYGLDQGFDTYGDLSQQEAAGRVDTSIRGAAADGQAASGERYDAHLERRAEEITGRGIELLKEQAAGDRPFFIFLHYFDPHQPNQAPSRLASQYTDGYFAEIAYFDEQFGKLMDALRALKLDDRTLVILTSDHGEGRGQHGELTHSNFLYDSTLHVPLILWAPERIPAGAVVPAQVRHIDLAPTILEFARLTPSPQVQGESLLPLLSEGAAERADLPCYSDTFAPRTRYGFSALRSLRADGWKYILAPKPELYHVAKDPLELVNLAHAHADRAAEMRQQLRELIAASPPPPGRRAAPVQITEADMRKLEAIGYVASAPAEDDALAAASELDDFEPTGANPIDHLEEMEMMAWALGAFRVGAFEDSKAGMRRLLELTPENPTALSHLAASLERLGEHAEAISTLRRLIELHPDRWMDQRSLGILLGARGQYKAAERHLREALALYPADATTHESLGQLLVLAGRHAESIREFTAAAEFAPDSAEARFFLGLALRLDGRAEDAIQALRDALRVNPRFLPAYVQLREMLVTRGRTGEAIDHLNRAVRKLPDRPILFRLLADCHHQAADSAAPCPDLARFLLNIPGDSDALDGWAADVIALGQSVEALAVLERGVGPEPGEVAGQLRRAAVLRLLGRTHEAVDRLMEAVEAHADSIPLHRTLGRLLSERGDLDRAGECYTLVLELAPDRSRSWRNLGLNLLARNRGREALEHLRKAQELAPDKPENVAALARALRTAGRTREAAQMYERLIAMDPENAAAYSARAALLDEGGDAAGAIALLRRGLETLPRDADLANDLAWRLATSGRAELRDDAQAVKLAEKANRLSGDAHVNVLDTLAAAYAAAGRFDDAVNTAARALEIARRANDTDLAARIASRLSRYQRHQPYRDG